MSNIREEGLNEKIPIRRSLCFAQDNQMNFRRIGITLSIISLATSVASNTTIQCNQDLEFTWSYDEIDGSSIIQEISDNLSTVSMNIDFGFLKLFENDGNQSELYRQSAIKRSNDDPEDIVVRYDSTLKASIKKKSVIISDPMCKNRIMPHVNILETTAASYSNRVYSCKCFSRTYDGGVFIFFD